MHGTLPQQPRRFLFLQGMPTRFLARLGTALAGRGHGVKRINFTAGDRLYWDLPGSVDYRGDLQSWPGFLENCLNEWRITDVVLFGDWRPLHAAAIRICALRGLAVHVFEEGYLRPNWVTLERGGVNSNSSLPREPEWFHKEAASLPAWHGGEPVNGSFFSRAVLDVIYTTCNLATAWRFPDYRSHLPLHPVFEYAGWIGRFLRSRKAGRETARNLRALATANRPYFVFPLQLDADSQLRINSSFGSLAPAINAVLTSFAQHAPHDTQLVIKEHPLDPQITDWRALADASAQRLGIAGRVTYLVGGDIAALAQHSRGLVTVNSTSGVLALSAGVPVMALAKPIYEMPGLTFQHGIDRFWREAAPPDPMLFDAFRRVVAHRTQVNGGFFSRRGLALAVQGSVQRLEGGIFEPAMAASAVSAKSGNDMLEDDVALVSGGAG